jgi:hypothetical protein
LFTVSTIASRLSLSASEVICGVTAWDGYDGSRSRCLN